MSQNDTYEEAKVLFMEKIEELISKVDAIEIKTIVKQTARNDLIMIRDFFKMIDNSSLKNTVDFTRRFMIICRSLFVDIMSSFEYEIRNFILNHQDSELENLKQELENKPLKGITSLINGLHGVGYWDNDDNEKLVGLFAIRNMIVHNYTTVDNRKDMVPHEIQEMFGDFTIGKRMYGKPEIFLDIIYILIEFYLIWYRDKSILEHIFDQDQLANH